MAYITKFDGRTDKTIKLGGEGNPSSIEGYFLGTKDTQSEFGPGKLHIFQTSEGVVGVWGKTRMNSLLTEAHKGQMLLVSFTGMIPPSKKGRRPSYGYKLKYDPSNTIDVSNIDLNAAPSSEEEGEEESYSAESYEHEETMDEVVPPAPVAPRVSATAPSASAQARVQALLNKGKAKA